MLSPRDLPLWARLAAAVLVVVSSWWLLHTAVVRDAVGQSVTLVGAGVIAAFVLRGTSLPLGLWPEGALRNRFRPAWVLGVVAVFGGLLVLSNPATSPALSQALDRGTYAMVVIGAVAWGFALAYSPHRMLLPWFALGVVAAAAPSVVGGLTSAASSRCVFAMDASSVPCDAGMVQAAAFTGVVATATSFVTLELAFRRMILGASRGAGLVLVVLSAVATAAWFIAVDPGNPGIERVAWWGLAALGTAALYAGCGSLLVSSMYTGVFAAGEASLRFGSVESAGPDALTIAAHGLSVLVLVGLVTRNNGVASGLRSDSGRGSLEATDEALLDEIEDR